jgi:hypothetical protein
MALTGYERAKTPARSNVAVAGITRSGGIARHFDSENEQYHWKAKEMPTTTWTTKRY